MLKRIVFATVLALGVAIGSVGTVAAKTGSGAAAKKVDVTPKAPQGLPCGMGGKC